MGLIILILVILLLYFILRFIFEINVRKIKVLGEDKQLDSITQKYPGNIEICKYYLKKLNNQNVKIEEDENSNSTLYLIISNKILIGNLKNNYTRIQTIAHECLHSIQSKKILWFNFIFSNLYIIYFLITCILAIFRILPDEMLFMSILIIFGIVYYAVRMYLEMDAMLKAKFLAKEYMQEVKISCQEEIDRIINKYEELNNLGIKYMNFSFLSNIFLKLIILSIIFIVF